MKRTIPARTLTGILLASLALLAAACFVRAFYGFDWSDETYYTALPYRYAMGDRLFSDGWEIHQLSVMFTLPLIRLFLLCSGGTTAGIMLYMRLLFVAFQFVTALFLFFSLRRRYGQVVAALIAAIALMFAHFALPNFSYDTLVILFSFWSVGFLARAMDGRSPCVSAGFCGLFYAFAVQSYPQYVTSFLFFLLFWILRERRLRRCRQRDRQFPAFLLGIAGAVALFLLFVMTHSSLSALIENLPYLLSDPMHEPQPVLALLYEYLSTVYVVIGLPLLLLIGLTAACCCWRFLPACRRDARMREWLLTGVAAAAIWMLLRLLFYDLHAYAKLNFLAMPLAFCCPALLLISNRDDLPLPALLFFLGTTLSVSVQLISSNMGIYAFSFPLLLASVGAILAGRDCLTSPERRPRRLTPALCITAAMLLFAGISVLRIAGLYRVDGTLSEQTAVLASGPAKGIRATEQSAATYEKLVREITENTGDGPVLIVQCLPFGYLCDGVRTGTPSVWSVRSTVRAIEYYNQNPDKRPETILVIDASIGNSNLGYKVDLLAASFPERAAYTATELETCVVYQRTNG